MMMRAITPEIIEYEAAQLRSALELASRTMPSEADLKKLGEGQIVFAASARGLKQQLEAIKQIAAKVLERSDVNLEVQRAVQAIIACADLGLSEARGDYYPRGRDLLEYR
jgi:hypothetical protein